MLSAQSPGRCPVSKNLGRETSGVGSRGSGVGKRERPMAAFASLAPCPLPPAPSVALGGSPGVPRRPLYETSKLPLANVSAVLYVRLSSLTYADVRQAGKPDLHRTTERDGHKRSFTKVAYRRGSGKLPPRAADMTLRSPGRQETGISGDRRPPVDACLTCQKPPPAWLGLTTGPPQARSAKAY
jgi:hypothetical protein